MTQRKPIFLKSLAASLVILGFGAYLGLRSAKTKTEFNKISGTIDYLDDSFENQHPRDHRFIHLKRQSQVFDLFIGKGKGDFGPEFEKLDDLSVGDNVTVYFADAKPLQKNRNYEFNKTVQFIDKDGAAYFVRGNKDKMGSYFFLGMGSLLVIGITGLKLSGKIR